MKVEVKMATVTVSFEAPVELAGQLTLLRDRLPEIIELGLRQWRDTTLPPLPQDVEAELAAFSSLSNEVLGVLADSVLPEKQRQELASLNHEAQQHPLTEAEKNCQQSLVEAYDRVLVRRAQAAALLKSRGVPLPTPAVP